MSEIKGYKRLNLDMTCRNFKYKVGKTYKIPEEKLKICGKGFVRKTLLFATMMI